MPGMYLQDFVSEHGYLFLAENFNKANITVLLFGDTYV